MGSLGVCFEVWEEGNHPLSKTYKLEIRHVSTHMYIYVVSENVPFSPKALLILLIPAFFNQLIFAKIVSLLKAIARELC